MKKLILYDHMGNKLLEQEVFVEGQDFTWQSPKPVAFWLGEICLVDKEPEPELVAEGTTGITTLAEIFGVKEVEHEPTEADNQNTGDSRVSEASEPKSIEGIHEESAGGELAKRGKKPRKRKAA